MILCAGDNIHVIEAELAKIRESIDWKVESGWPRTLAEDYTLIMRVVRVFTDAIDADGRHPLAAAGHSRTAPRLQRGGVT